LEFENNYFTEMCSDSEAGSYLRLIDFVYHSTLGLRVIKKKKKSVPPDRVFAMRSNAGRKLLGERQFKLPWREAGPPNHRDDKVDSDQ